MANGAGILLAGVIWTTGIIVVWSGIYITNSPAAHITPATCLCKTDGWANRLVEYSIGIYMNSTNLLFFTK